MKWKCWSIDEELLLLSLWAEKEGDLRTCKRNSHIYAKMSEEMGGKFTGQEIHIKVANFTQRYRTEKKKVGPPGGSPSEWQHFQRVHEIIGQHAVNSNRIVESFSFFSHESVPLSTPPFPALPISPSEELLTSPPLSSPEFEAPSRRNKKNLSAAMLEQMDKLTMIGEENVNVLKALAEDTHNLCKSFQGFMEAQQENETEFLHYFKHLAEKD